MLVTMGIGRLWLAGLTAGLPRVVAPAHLVTANALFPTAGTIASAATTFVGLLLMRVLGADAATALILCVAVGLLISAGIASRMPSRALGPVPGEVDTTSLTSDLAAVARGMVAGAAHINARPRARRAMAVVLAHRVAFGALLVDALLLLRTTLNPVADADAALADFAVAVAGAAIGSLSAAVLTPYVVRALGPARWSALTLFVAAVVAPIGFASVQLVSITVAAFTMGFAGQAIKIVGDTILQSDIDDAFRGRVFSLYDVGLGVALVTGITVTALTAPASGLAPGIWIGAGLLLGATGLWSLRPSAVRG